MSPAQIMRRAARLLNEDAQAGRESCQVGDQDWACPDCPGKRGGVCAEKEASDERRKMAASLLALAEAL